MICVLHVDACCGVLCAAVAGWLVVKACVWLAWHRVNSHLHVRDRTTDCSSAVDRQRGVACFVECMSASRCASPSTNCVQMGVSHIEEGTQCWCVPGVYQVCACAR